MSRLFYMSLAGVGAWDMVIRESGAQLRPYVSYLETAMRAVSYTHLDVYKRQV